MHAKTQAQREKNTALCKHRWTRKKTKIYMTSMNSSRKKHSYRYYGSFS